MKTNYEDFWNVLTGNKTMHHVGEGLYYYKKLGLLGFNDYGDLMPNTIEVLLGVFEGGRANGKQMMFDVVEAADKVGVKLIILPEYITLFPEEIKISELVKWLRKFGFVGTGGRMLRKPLKNL